MERPIQIDDFVKLKLGDQTGEYQIKEIADNHDIIVSMILPKKNDKEIIIRYNNIDNKWKFIDIAIDHDVVFSLNIRPETIQDYQLNRIIFPDFRTLVFKENSNVNHISMIEIDEIIDTSENVIQNPDIGTFINNANIHNISNNISNVNESQLSTVTVGVEIPQTYEEARNKLHMISGAASSKKRTFYRVDQLKAICKNLKLSTSGNKKILAERLTSAIKDFTGA